MYKESDVVRVAKRENNNKRKYLVVNRLQGKHVPVSPKAAFDMFKSLADTIREEYKDDNLLLVGFAETATAIGAAVAVEIGAKYMQTTREIIPDVDYMFFSEEHSHATEQKLVKNDIDSVIEDIDRIVFIEDEVTTGNTILNIIKILEKLYPDKVSYSVASLLNGMDSASSKIYQEKDIKVHYILKTTHDGYTQIAESFAGDGHYIECDTKDHNIQITDFYANAWENARRVVAADKYVDACNKLWTQIQNQFFNGDNSQKYQNVLVVGTEEFMYPAIYVARQIENMGITVKTHSTTRSPIAVSTENDYPVHNRYELRSMYDSQRVTFLYDIDKYDCVFVITDAQDKTTEGVNSLVNAFSKNGNENIVFINWIK